jgi:CcmD family protein
VKRLLRLSAWAGLAMTWPALLWAQDAQKEFVPADSIAKQEIPAEPLLYGAYAFVWAALIVYVFFLWRRIGRVERELRDVNRRLASK